ncbi:hypothetical protein QBC34DRAFT_17142 [Podospora aff. communis PSN243]|uniref:Uncharacterized protein n=1 Tax=Podospora aff. communis PSN243 TaxID=3040156 RepID=A0AAV9GX50_9PEZI|nr:hypothetical protein QBC34DRAFT_17142 [Podospora aff. communis PSN243]
MALLSTRSDLLALQTIASAVSHCPYIAWVICLGFPDSRKARFPAAALPCFGLFRGPAKTRLLNALQYTDPYNSIRPLACVTIFSRLRRRVFAVFRWQSRTANQGGTACLTHRTALLSKGLPTCERALGAT